MKAEQKGQKIQTSQGPDMCSWAQIAWGTSMTIFLRLESAETSATSLL